MPTTDFSAFHDELRTVARELFGKTPPDTPAGWRRIADSGWLGLEIPEHLDGAGATFAETAVVLREAGRAAAHGPYASVAALAIGALTSLEPSPERDGLLRETAAGAVLPVVAWDGGSTSGVPFRIERTAHGPLLHGAASFVLDAPAADHLLLPALTPDGTPVVADVDPRDTGLSVTAQQVLDATRNLGHVVADGVNVQEESLWRFQDDPAKAVRRLHDRAAVAIACDSLGLGEAMLDATVAYAKVREQFGRPIGSFQAVKHACADMLVQLTIAGKLVAAAVAAQVNAAPDASAAASMAKSHTCAAAVEVVGKAMQLHGGMGYTWESGIHVHLKRATLNRSLFGSPAAHRRRLADRYLARTDQ